MKTSKLNEAMCETLLISIHRAVYKKYKGAPLWSFIAFFCAVGSTSAIEICRELGWDPHQDGAIRLERQLNR